MRSISSNRKNKKPILFIAIILVVIAAAIAVAFFLSQQKSKELAVNEPTRPANTVDYGPPSAEEQQAAEQQKEEILQQQETAQNGNSNETSAISVTIIRANQTGGGQPLNIRADITGASSGTCEVALRKPGQPTVSKSFPVVFEATSSRCEAADIPASDFTESGDWQLSLVIKSGGKQSVPVEQRVTLDKQ